MEICKNFFSGFCFENESELFKEYLVSNDFTVSGFSYGAIKAFEYVLNSKNRVDKLQLFSPAFFQTKDDKFKRMQLMFFKKDENSYINSFLGNVKSPIYKDIEKYFKKGSFEELETLLNYIWIEGDLEKLIKNGLKIEVFLGEKDLIIDSLVAKDFFKNYATVYYFKDKGHLL
ncbi:pimelyl-ACP methyl ester esterase BioV [Aliarcobacter vitoriensis]|uniref:pimelyl-ACP methyl ester esterase BioV n=1 Tax=Aliarcobacter vitoriensis TaxID=2011099 RepID=UPI003AAE7E16